MELPSVARQPFAVHHLDAPPHFARPRSIHPRHVLPLVREGRERRFPSQTRQIIISPPAPRAMGPADAADELILAVNTELPGPAASQTASNVGEPSVAVNGNVVFFTGNWYAARSVDGGRTFQYIDPAHSFPDPPGLHFCCDQVVNYIPSIDTFVWLLQYGLVDDSAPQHDNIQRLAFAKTQDVAAGKWRLFDITTAALGVPGQFMDFPDLAVGANALYITTNLFPPGAQSPGSAVVRIPFASIESGQVAAARFVSNDFNSFRVAQNCGTAAFFAAHKDSSTLQVYKWDEAQPQPVPSVVEVASWIGRNGYFSRTPDGRTWLDRADSRITGAALAGADLYFAWTVDGQSNQRSQPFVQIARIDAGSLTLIENINVFDQNSATSYAALATNTDGEVGISYAMGGGPRFPSQVVGILTGARKDVIVASSDRGPLPRDDNGHGEWGDYLAVRPVQPDNKLFAAAGYTLKGVSGGNQDATPRFVVFGRAGRASGQAAAAMASLGVSVKFAAPPMARRPLPTTPADDGEPITDVESLSVVSPDVAAKIKAAAGLSSGPEAAPAVQAAPPLPEAFSPGTERWPVKTGQDPDRAKVGKNIIAGEDLGAGIVETTVEELAALPRPPGMEDSRVDPPEFQDVRDGVTEVTIWRVDASVISLKHEQDGDYHLVLQGQSGQEMIAEIPTPTTEFIGDSPWLGNIGDARKQVDERLVRHLSPAAFGLVQGKFMPHGATTAPMLATAPPGMSLMTPPPGSGLPQPLFQSAIAPTQARITGIGFFDRAHGATGAAPNVIELHPVLKIEWL